jgi:phosphate starvation-inducible protein PhoH
LRERHNHKKRPVKNTGIDRPNPVEGKTPNQRFIMQEYSDGKNLLIHGLAGTGKTFLACYLASNSVFAGEQERVIIYRSAVPTRDMGFMPGSMAEKQEPYETPYRYVFAELHGRGDAYEVLTHNRHVEFSTSSYLRGLTIRDSVIIVDEVQSWTWHEIDSIMTRVGDGSRIIVCGDFRQSDLRNNEDRTGFTKLLKVATGMPEFAVIEMKAEDILRSGFVKSYLLTKDSLKVD